MEGSRYGVVCGSVGSEWILLRVQVGRDVFFLRALNQFLKALLLEPQSGSHVDSRLCRYRDDDGCLEAGEKVSCE